MGAIGKDCNLCSGQVRLYLTGELPTPKYTDALYKSWLVENSLVLAWLINSMEPQISRRYLWFDTAKDVWDVARSMYLDLGNASQMFEIRSKLKEMKQGSISVTRYFSDLQNSGKNLICSSNKTMHVLHAVLNCRNILRKKESLIFLLVSIVIWMRCVVVW